jgi:hypothetical protein
MSYANSWYIRYSAPAIQQQTEVAVVTAAGQVINEDPATPDHTNRLNWANWATGNSKGATNFFLWPVAMNPTIQESIATDPTGGSVKDSDIQFVINSNLPAAVAYFVAHPPPA